jgi:hypothetical protein
MHLSELAEVGVSNWVGLSVGRVREPPDSISRVGNVGPEGEVDRFLRVLSEPTKGISVSNRVA